jgi:hypothetical protein
MSIDKFLESVGCEPCEAPFESHEKIYYKEVNYKYKLEVTYITKLDFAPKNDIISEYVCFNTAGILVIRKGYAWDGASGPAINTKNFLRGSLEHDALYQLLMLGLLPQSYRLDADKRLRDTCIADGMWKIRAQWVYLAVRTPIAGRYAKVRAKEKALTAP